MKSPALLLVALLALLTVRLPAQVTVEVTLEQEQFLAGESMPAAVRITNRSGQTLQLGKEEGWVVFSIESPDNYVVQKTGDIPVAGEFTLESSKRAIKRVDLAPYFILNRSGRYAVTATVTIKDWNNQTITSKPKSFDIVRGAKLWEQEFGVPPAAGAPVERPEVRKYTLQQANYLKQLRLYLQVTDASGKIYKVLAIGPLLSFGQPEPQLDKFSNLHLLYQDGAHSFSYLVFDPDGEVLRRQSYEYTTRPRLKIDGDGYLAVVGGTRRITANDVPAPRSSERSPTPSIPTPQP